MKKLIPLFLITLCYYPTWVLASACVTERFNVKPFQERELSFMERVALDEVFFKKATVSHDTIETAIDGFSLKGKFKDINVVSIRLFSEQNRFVGWMKFHFDPKVIEGILMDPTLVESESPPKTGMWSYYHQIRLKGTLEFRGKRKSASRLPKLFASKEATLILHGTSNFCGAQFHKWTFHFQTYELGQTEKIPVIAHGMVGSKSDKELSNQAGLFTLTEQNWEQRWKDWFHEYPSVQPLLTPQGFLVKAAPFSEAKTLKTRSKSTKLEVMGYLERPEGRYYLSQWSWKQVLKGKKPNWIWLMQEEAGVAPELSSPELSQKPEFWPLEKGQYWIYQGTVKWTEGKRVIKDVLTWKMEVVEEIKRQHIKGYVLKGHPNDLIWYHDGKERSEHIIIQVGADKYYEGDRTLFNQLKNEPDISKLVFDNSRLLLDLPLVDGKPLAGGEIMVQTVKLAKIKGLAKLAKEVEQYSLEYRNLSDMKMVDFVAGIGMVGFNYLHYGSVSEVDVRLVEVFTP
jgi:hypothetical protein